MHRFLKEAGIAGVLLLLPLVMFWAQTLGGRTLLPTENLYKYEPFAAYADVVDAPEPHNALLDDLILQNYQWKSFIRQSIAEAEVPLWNPHQFGGTPFFATGQQSTLYPLSIVYYLLPLEAAYGWFTVLALWLAGWLMSAFLRGLKQGVLAGLIAGVVYQLCGFFIASAVHPMILGAAVFMPALLLMAEFIVRDEPVFGRPARPLWAVLGAFALAFNIFAGHPELTIYTLLITAFYGGLRLLDVGWRARSAWRIVSPSAWLAGMVALGFALGAVQFIPLYEAAEGNWRTERGELATVLGFAHPPRDVIQFILPNFYGNPAHDRVFDWFTLDWQPVTVNAFGDAVASTDWGIKNYVEAALYVGIMPLVLAFFALIDGWLIHRRRDDPPYRLIFFALTLISLTFMFGLPTYALIYPLPGINQLNTPFRWVYGVTIGVAVLAGFGTAALGGTLSDARRRWIRRLAVGLLGLGALILVGLLGARLAYDSIVPLVERVFTGMAKAQFAFPDVRTFFNYQLTNALVLGGMLAGGGVILLAASRRARRGLWAVALVGLIALDLMIASWNFNPASDPALLDFTPPSIQWLVDRQVAGEHFRYTTVESPVDGLDKLLQPNMTMIYGLDDIRGYDSIIDLDTVAYMRATTIQPGLDANRIAPLYLDRIESGEVDWNRLDLLNVGYVVTYAGVDLPDDLTDGDSPRLSVVHETPVVRIYRNNFAVGPAVLLPGRDDQPPAVGDMRPASTFAIQDFTRPNSRERLLTVDFESAGAQWLVLSESYAPGWRAFVRPLGIDINGEQADERELSVVPAADNFSAVLLDPIQLARSYVLTGLSAVQDEAVREGLYAVRLIYSPTSFQVGAFGSAIGLAVAVFLGGLWGWGVLVGAGTDESSDASLVARNSIAPILLNLFNRGIDFAFAFVMLRILGPEAAGIYYYAIVVFVWFDIITNFGLDVFLIREASREKPRAGFYLFNTTVLRLVLVFACVPLVLGFIVVRQATVDPQLSQEALLAIGLLYIGLAPASISKGLTSIFYAFQKAEYPAAVTTVTTINKAVLGLIVLLLGFGIVGLAAVSIAVNLVTLAILSYAALGVLRLNRPATPPPPEERGANFGLVRRMVGESWPLMLNHFLATIFFQIDIILLEALRGARIVGQYSVAYRWLLAINIIPAFFTQALLPVMSRQAENNRDQLKRTYTLGIKLLVGLAIPLAVLLTFLAEALTLFLGGAAFMPAGAVALQIMVWSIPFGWMNSLTQYALIAVDLQRRITRAFLLAVSFNIITNLLFIPAFGYQAAAVTTILSEIVLLVPFGLLMQSALGKLDWLDMVWRPAVAGAVMFAITGLLWPLAPLVALVAGGLAYAGLMIVFRPLSPREWAMLAPVLPGRVKKLLPIQ